MHAFQFERLVIPLNEEGARKLHVPEICLLGVDVDPATRMRLEIDGEDFYVALWGEWTQEELLAVADKKMRPLVKGEPVVYDRMEGA